MYQLIKGYPIEQLKFNTKRVRGRGKNYKTICTDIFMFDTETTSAFVDENGNVSGFDYDNPEKSRNSLKHSLCYLWAFGIGANTRYIGRELTDLVLLLNKLNKYCPYEKICYVHNLGFDFCFLENIIEFSDVFARRPRHPMRATDKKHNLIFKCSYTLMCLSLDNWAKSLNLDAQKKIGYLDYKKIRTPKTPLTEKELEYQIADLDVIYYGILKLINQYGDISKIPLTHTGKARLECEKEMENEKDYCRTVTKLLPQNIDEFIEQSRAFIGGTVLCNWLFKNRTLEDVDAYDITSSYPWVMVSSKCLYPMTPFFICPRGKESQYINNNKYVYLIHFKAYNILSKYNCHFLSKSKTVSRKNVECDNGRIYKADMVECVLTSVDYELFIQLYDISKIKIIVLKFAKGKPLNKTFRKFILKLYRDKTELKGIPEKLDLYANRKGTVNSMYGDFCTKLWADEIVFNNDTKQWDLDELTPEKFDDVLKKLSKKSYKNYKAFIHGVFVTAWARRRIWTAVLYEDMDEHIIYTDTDSLKMYQYTGDFFEKANAEILAEYEIIKKDLGVTDADLMPLDIKGNPHPLGLWDKESHVKFFRSLGCKQYICEYDDGSMALTCAGISKRAVKCFKTVDDFKTDRRLTEKELLESGAEKLTPYYDTNYPNVVYPDGYISRYKCGVCLMPTTFNLSITPNDLKLLYMLVYEKTTKLIYRKGGM